MKRVFIGIPLSTELQAKVEEFRNTLNVHVRWLALKNLHVTIIPPWNEENIEDVQKILEVIKLDPFNIQFDLVTFGPEPNAPRLIWAEGSTPAQLEDLKFNIERLLGKREEREMKLHATLARFKPTDFENFATKNLQERIHWQQTVGRFVLYESKFTEQEGVDYMALAEFLAKNE